MNGRESTGDHAAQVIEDVRGSRIPSPELCRRLLSLDNLDSLRNAVTPGDLDAIIRLLVQATTPDVFRVGVHMLQGIGMNTHEKHVRERLRGVLEGAWLDARNDPDRGRSITAALMDHHDLPPFFHAEFFDFYLRTWDQGRHYFTSLCDGSDRILEWTSKRLQDPRFPATKHWAYILVLGYSSDREGVAKLIGKLHPTDDPLCSRAIAEVQNRLRLDKLGAHSESASIPADGSTEI